MRILKFGGTSVAHAANIQRVIAIVQEKIKAGPVVLVVSALGGTTDKLIEAGRLAAEAQQTYREVLAALEARHSQAVRELLPPAQQSAVLSLVKKSMNELDGICSGIFLLGELTPRALDKLMSFGEALSSQIVSAALTAQGIQNVYADTRRLIVTNANYGNAAVDVAATDQAIAAFVEANPARLYVAPGFIAATPEGIVTTLGRGGSDYTAAVFAAALRAETLEIWTDVSGMMTADPRIVAHARPIANLPYQVAMELSHFGAKVIYPPTIQPVMSRRIPTWIKNTLAPADYGTLLESAAPADPNIISGISSMGRVAMLLLEGSGMVGIPGFSRRLFGALAGARINVILITQSSSEHSICVAVDEANAEEARRAVDAAFADEIALGKVEPLSVETGLAIIAIVGDNMKNHPGISGRMFGALGRNGINIRAIAQGSSERNISAVILAGDVKKAVNVLHEEFFETVFKQINLFVVGVGNVGQRLLAQLERQHQFLQEHLRLNVRLVGLANSRRVLLYESGLNFNDWVTQLETAPSGGIAEVVQFIQEKNLRNSIFVDNTADPNVAACYADLLRKSVAVVTCNKIACSANFAHYAQLKALAREYQAPFLFETNVGAGLPVIGTLNDLLHSGDRVLRIQAVLSGTLNFVFNHYDGTRPFAEVVRQAQAEGYTEPDPRLDLGGTDVMRKILILAREAGLPLEMADIANETFLPESCLAGSVEDFYEEMERHEAHFAGLYRAAAEQGKKLKFVASLHENKAAVGLQQVGPEHDFYHLYGKDNAVLFYTERYREQPLVIKGAGAGAEVTASGVFADIIRAARGA